MALYSPTESYDDETNGYRAAHPGGTGRKAQERGAPYSRYPGVNSEGATAPRSQRGLQPEAGSTEGFRWRFALSEIYQHTTWKELHRPAERDAGLC
jgi:hypothetical protein